MRHVDPVPAGSVPAGIKPLLLDAYVVGVQPELPVSRERVRLGEMKGRRGSRRLFFQEFTGRHRGSEADCSQFSNKASS
jgi:hypothetical protein